MFEVILWFYVCNSIGSKNVSLLVQPGHNVCLTVLRVPLHLQGKH